MNAFIHSGVATYFMYVVITLVAVELAAERGHGFVAHAATLCPPSPPLVCTPFPVPPCSGELVWKVMDEACPLASRQRVPGDSAHMMVGGRGSKT